MNMDELVAIMGEIRDQLIELNKMAIKLVQYIQYNGDS